MKQFRSIIGPMPPKLLIDDMRDIATRRGGRCLSDTYAGAGVGLRWACAKGHEWQATPRSARAGYWCMQCSPTAKRTLADMQGMAAARGGACLSETYTNTRTPLTWRCAKGHEWTTRPAHIKAGNWCPDCGRAKTQAAVDKKRLSIEAMCSVAESRGGRCLSLEYINQRDRLQWECAEGHTWEATATAVHNGGTWCPHCSGRLALDIERARTLAQAHGGLLLSTRYVNNAAKLDWECRHGHRFAASVNHVKDSVSWCPTCAGRYNNSIEVARQIALERGGECLSERYLNQRAPLRWRCGRGHEWSSALFNIKISGTWCPYCLYKNEDECRQLFESLIKKAFPKQRPEWLGGLELDGYCQQLRLAFEYQGEQHYQVILPWHKRGAADLAAQQQRDKRKADLCAEEGVALVVVPYWVSDKKAHIQAALAELGYEAGDPWGSPAQPDATPPGELNTDELEEILGFRLDG